jgi:hypothetical protein
MRKILAAILVGGVVCAATTYPSHGADGLTYESPSGYGVDIPDGWEYGTGLMGADLFAIAPPAEEEEHGTANFNVMVGESGGMTLDQFYDASLSGLKAIVEGLEIEKSGDVDLGGMKAKWHVYTYPHYKVDLKVLQYVAIDGPTVYVLTFTTGNKDYAYYQPTFEKVMKSFKLVKKEAPVQTSFQPAEAGFRLGSDWLMERKSVEALTYLSPA